MRHTSLPLSVVVGALAVLAAPALAAYVCHPDPAGTHSLRLRGHVLGYTLRGSDLVVAVRDGGTCRTLTWSASDGRTAASTRGCRALTQAQLPPAPRTVRIERPAVGTDRPDRLDVLDARGTVVRSWPLPVRVRRHTLQLSGSLAAYSALGGNGLWVTRLTDGQTTFVAPIRAGDRPRLDAQGVAYQDNVYKRARADRPLLKFVPTAALEWELAQVGAPVHTSGPIRSVSMDGTRVALAVGGGASGCDNVVFWNIPWRSVEQVSQKRGVTCAASGASRRISQVALGGARAQWITSQHGRPVLVAADDIGCQEWVIARLSDRAAQISLDGIAAQGPTLAFALADRRRGGTVSVGQVVGAYRGSPSYRLAGAAQGIAADGLRTAVLTTGHRVQVRSFDGRLLQTFRAPDASALALRGDRIVTTTSSGRLDVYAASTGALLHSWRLPGGSASRVDVADGIAVVTAGPAVYAVELATGRTARLALAPSAARVQIGSAGVVYTYSVGARGTAEFVPMSAVEAALR